MSDARGKRSTRDSARNGAAADLAQPVAQAAVAAAAPEDAGAPLSPAPLPPSPPARTAEPAAADDDWSVLVAAQAALARAGEAFAAEVGVLTRESVVAGTDAALALLGARTLAEAVEINAGWARRGFDTLLAASARLSEIGVKAIAETTHPILSHLSMPHREIAATDAVADRSA